MMSFLTYFSMSDFATQTLSAGAPLFNELLPYTTWIIGILIILLVIAVLIGVVMHR